MKKERLNESRKSLPAFARNDALALVLAVGVDTTSRPPVVIVRVGHVENIAVVEC